MTEAEIALEKIRKAPGDAMKTAYTLYQTHGFTKDAEEDVWAEGCIPESGTCFSGGTILSAATSQELVDTIRDFVGAEPEDMILDYDEEPGKVLVQVYEDADGVTATERDLAEWQAGRKRLWLVTYGFRAERVTHTPVPLIQAGFNSQQEVT